MTEKINVKNKTTVVARSDENLHRLVCRYIKATGKYHFDYDGDNHQLPDKGVYNDLCLRMVHIYDFDLVFPVYITGDDEIIAYFSTFDFTQEAHDMVMEKVKENISALLTYLRSKFMVSD